MSVNVRSITCRNSSDERKGAIRRESNDAHDSHPPSPILAPAMSDPIHVHPTAPLAPRVLLPGDPGRALRLAQALLHEPRMFNHNRGLWGYSGDALTDGRPLTIQSTGMGGPSAAIVVAELCDLGATSLLRVGTCGAIADGPQLGAIVVVRETLAADGTSRALGGGERIAPSPGLLERLRAAAAQEPGDPSGVLAACTDLFYDPREGIEHTWARAGASVVEMETATLFALATARGVEAGALLIVSDLLFPARRRIADEALAASELRLGELAMAALSEPGAA
jgi:uridine phosphorylase